MGWCSFHLDEPAKDWFTRSWKSNDLYEVLEVALVKRTTIYAAVKELSTGDVYCVVYLVHWTRGWFNFCYKDMTEHSGPCVYDCPEKIFKLLTPLKDNDDNRFAIEWRKKVEQLHKNRKLLKGECIVKVAVPIGFNNGMQISYFKKVGRAMYGGIMENDKFLPYTRVRKFSLANHEFEIIK